MQGLSLVVASGGHSSSWCAGLSLSRPLLLRSTGSRCTGSAVVAHGPSCSAACGIFPDQGSNPFPCIGRQILNHCATREALDTSILLHFLFENILHLSFPFWNGFYLITAFFFILANSNVSIFFSFTAVLLVPYLRILCLTQSHKDFIYVFFWKFIVLALTFRSMVHFELIFVYGVR